MDYATWNFSLLFFKKRIEDLEKKGPVGLVIISLVELLDCIDNVK